MLRKRHLVVGFIAFLFFIMGVVRASGKPVGSKVGDSFWVYYTQTPDQGPYCAWKTHYKVITIGDESVEWYLLGWGNDWKYDVDWQPYVTWQTQRCDVYLGRLYNTNVGGELCASTGWAKLIPPNVQAGETRSLYLNQGYHDVVMGSETVYHMKYNYTDVLGGMRIVDCSRRAVTATIHDNSNNFDIDMTWDVETGYRLNWSSHGKTGWDEVQQMTVSNFMPTNTGGIVIPPVLADPIVLAGIGGTTLGIVIVVLVKKGVFAAIL